MSVVVFTTFGSHGDLHPYLAVARALDAAGHTVAIATSEMHRESVEAAGLELRPVRPHPDVAANPELDRRINDRVKGPTYLLHEILFPHLRETCDDLLAAVSDADLLVSHPLTLTAPLVAEVRGLRWLSSALAPIIFMSTHDPPVFAASPWFRDVRRLGHAPYRALFSLVRRGALAWAEPLISLRRDVGLPPAETHPLFEGQFSPSGTLALFSGVLAAPQPDWPPATTLTGFVYHDRVQESHEASTRVEEFLDSGPPPIVFTLGTVASRDARDFFRVSAVAARAVGRRALLLCGDASRIPEGPLPSGTLAVGYAPYSSVFRRAAAIVHQGGIGTLAQALHAGRPMLMVPFSHDQFDNAYRAAALGVGRRLSRARYRVRPVRKALARILDDPRYATTAEAVAARVRAEDGTVRACQLIEERLGRP